MRLNHIFYLLVVLLLVLCGLLLFYAGSDTKLFYCGGSGGVGARIPGHIL